MSDKDALKQVMARLNRAETILTRLCAAGVLTPGDVRRVLDGDYNFYAVLKNYSDLGKTGSYVVIINANGVNTARRVADVVIGRGNYTLRQEHVFDPAKHEGEVGRLNAITGELMVA